ncbi:hypothetical protein TNCV_2664651 [Trichonephila clavipes]|nr:hypothetical protein TNCV_2664651 [Trichonephila clavipes]
MTTVFVCGDPRGERLNPVFALQRHTAPTAGAIETSRNITTRVIECDISGEIYYFLEDSRGFRTRQHGRRSRQLSL